MSNTETEQQQHQQPQLLLPVVKTGLNALTVTAINNNNVNATNKNNKNDIGTEKMKFHVSKVLDQYDWTLVPVATK